MIASKQARPLCPSARTHDGIEALSPERPVSDRPRADGDEVQDAFQPGHGLGVGGRFDATREDAAIDSRVVVDATDARNDDSDHVLRSRRLDERPVLGRVELPHERVAVTVGQSISPESARSGASAGRHPAPVHEANGGLQRHHHHRSRRLGIERRHERLIDPPTGEGEPIGQAPDDIGQRWRCRRVRAAAIVRRRARGTGPPHPRFRIAPRPRFSPRRRGGRPCVWRTPRRSTGRFQPCRRATACAAPSRARSR